ncbi:alanine--tRNA ligase [Desulfurococcaceae archaeon MEX13E-LK6-19]|nr:alanine--tRNA ligase [Desulfurococcaceae archaeon MEX13E-LK6-19]
MTTREEPEYFSDFLKFHGYRRYTCRKCGEKFWSLVPRETCPDRPCSKYDFLINEYKSVPRLSLDEARKKFIDFFERNGHGYVDPYPVLARWRNDLYLTIASIIVFQPAVTEGIADPPYNPLVIVQPSIRLEDIDNVGLTFGRHLTSFEMAAHHAFNKPEKHIYWVNETLEYAFNFFTKELGIPAERIAFKESWWEGGGNAGPCFEVLVDGLELATLVFMKYKVIDGKYLPNKLTIVDTGYGVERITWFTQQTPTAFHAIYGDLVKKFADILGVEEPEYNVLKNIAYLTSDIDINSLEELEEIVKKNGYSEYIENIRSSIFLYTLLDHLRTLGLMLGDGIVPSNSGEGYLARLVLRRSLRTLYNLGFREDEFKKIILDLMEEEIKYWRNRYVYDKLYRNRDYILDVIEYETSKFVDTLKRGLRIVKKLLKKKHISTEDLIEVYDSHGIPPEIISSIARERGVEVRIPPDFYSLIAKRHASPGKLVKEKEVELPKDVVEWASKYPETKRIFHEDPYRRETTAKVLGVYKNYVVVDNTVFYPKAGGQDNDLGYMLINGKSIEIKAGYKVGDVIVHELADTSAIKPGDEVKIIIDWDRRYKLMRHHTATHIVLAAARAVLGDHVWQAGAEKTIEKGRLDITHHKPLTAEEIRKIEEIANAIIDKRIGIKFHTLKKFEAEKKYGLRIYQGGAIVADKLRIVEIPGWDAEACFGTHLRNTGEVGGLKIINVEKIQDGVIRLEYVAGTRVSEYAYSLEKTIEEVASILNTSPKEVIVSIKKFIDTYNKQRELLRKYRLVFKESILEKLKEVTMSICGINVVILRKEVDDEEVYRDIITSLVEKNYIVIYDNGKIIEIGLNPELSREKAIDLRKIVEVLKEKHGFKGGGKRDHVTIRYVGDSSKVVSEILDLLKEMINCVEK